MMMCYPSFSTIVSRAAARLKRNGKSARRRNQYKKTPFNAKNRIGIDTCTTNYRGVHVTVLYTSENPFILLGTKAT